MKMLTLTMVVTAQVALAGGALEVKLAPADAAKIEKQVALAKKAQPAAFEQVAKIQRDLTVIDAKKRGRFAPLTTLLNSVPEATWALVEAIVSTAAVAPEAPRTAVIAWQTGLLESLGDRRVLATEPVLMAALEAATEPEVIRSAADGLGRLGTDGAATALIAAASKREGAAREAVFAGMGSCRRTAVAGFLARQLALASTDSERLALVKGLSRVGNEWALETSGGTPAKNEIPAIRQLAASALVKLYAESQGHLRQAASDAVLVINAPETKVLLAQLRAKDPAAIDTLIAKTH